MRSLAFPLGATVPALVVGGPVLAAEGNSALHCINPTPPLLCLRFIRGERWASWDRNTIIRLANRRFRPSHGDMGNLPPVPKRISSIDDSNNACPDPAGWEARTHLSNHHRERLDSQHREVGLAHTAARR